MRVLYPLTWWPCLLLLIAENKVESFSVSAFNKGYEVLSTSYKYNTDLEFKYEYNSLSIKSGSNNFNTNNRDATVGILLIPPIGVGIGRWFYDKVFDCLVDKISQSNILKPYNICVVTPDLLGSGSASKPTSPSNNFSPSRDNHLPLFTVSNWSDQCASLLFDYSENVLGISDNISWYIVSNGGCVPIAIDIAVNSVTKDTESYEDQPVDSDRRVDAFLRGKIKGLVLSAPPRLPFFLGEPSTGEKIMKSYRTLCGVGGKLFWWYALRKNGKFIKTFTAKNLFASAEKADDNWTAQCVETAKSNDGFSKFSTFMFLAGALQGGGKESLDKLQQKLPIGVIMGGDNRKNPARSWFWQRKGSRKYQQDYKPPESNSLADYLNRNGNGGIEITVGGRRCPAYEDPDGFTDALITFLENVHDKPLEQVISKVKKYDSLRNVVFSAGTWQFGGGDGTATLI